MASAEHGYEDERFVQSISGHFHCGICHNVLKEPVTCQRHEHYVCRACITRHLKTSSTCPTCQEELSLETVIQAPKILRDCLDELNIRCDYSQRGCQEIVQLSQLETHAQVCGFAPVVCPNERCVAEINRQDLMNHQQVFCEFRKCCDCTEIKQIVEEINMSTKAVNNQMKELKNLQDIKDGLLAVKEEVSKTRDDTNQVLQRLEALEEQVLATNEMQKAIKKAQYSMNSDKTYQTQNILVAGGRRTDYGEMKFVELFNLSGMTWSPLQQMNESRVGASAFLSNNEITIVGGNTNHGPTETLTKMPITSIMKNASWSEVSTYRLPDKLYGHSSVLCDNVLINIGGCNKRKTCLKDIYNFPPPGFRVRLQCTMMPEPRCFHGAQVFDNKIHIFGGRSSVERSDSLDSVISYDFKENKIKPLASLPYPVSEMATVRWGDNVLLIGGVDHNGNSLATVVIYNVKTEKWHILPPMNERRKACSAVVIQDMIIVMGGRNQNNNCLRSVECFTFNNYSWQDFPAMITARERAVAVAF